MNPDPASLANLRDIVPAARSATAVRRRSFVAKLLHISVRTAEGHKAQIMDLLGARSTADLVQCAIRHGLIAPA